MHFELLLIVRQLVIAVYSTFVWARVSNLKDLKWGLVEQIGAIFVGLLNFFGGGGVENA